MPAYIFMNNPAILRLAEYLRQLQYRFVTITPLSHQRVLARAHGASFKPDLRDIFGWNRSFDSADIPAELMIIMRDADVLEAMGNQFKSRVRFSTLEADDRAETPMMFMHSAFPTGESDAVFFGPDSYRYAALIRAKLSCGDNPTILDLGTGSGIGGLVAAQAAGGCQQLLLSDINPKALAYAQVNTRLAGMQAQLVESDLYAKINTPVDVIVSNPPYLVDATARAYRHGGGEYGSLLSTRIVLEGLPLLRAGGMMILYTASAIVDGQDTFLPTVVQELEFQGLDYTYREIDPDVFGEELETKAYQRADRIAVVALVIKK